MEGILETAGALDHIHTKEILAVDGKVSSSSGRKESVEGEVKEMQMLSVHHCDTGVCVEQKVISEKTNEIPAAQEVLRLMDLKDMTVIADAMNCQKETAGVIRERRGDYVLALKGNQCLFYKEEVEYFDEECLEGLKKKEGCYRKNVEPEHGG